MWKTTRSVPYTCDPDLRKAFSTPALDRSRRQAATRQRRGQPVQRARPADRARKSGGCNTRDSPTFRCRWSTGDRVLIVTDFIRPQLVVDPHRRPWGRHELARPLEADPPGRLEPVACVISGADLPGQRSGRRHVCCGRFGQGDLATPPRRDVFIVEWWRWADTFISRANRAKRPCFARATSISRSSRTNSMAASSLLRSSAGQIAHFEDRYARLSHRVFAGDDGQSGPWHLQVGSARPN